MAKYKPIDMMLALSGKEYYYDYCNHDSLYGL